MVTTPSSGVAARSAEIAAQAILVSCERFSVSDGLWASVGSAVQRPLLTGAVGGEVAPGGKGFRQKDMKANEGSKR
jgi:hypothetical protein